MSLLEFCVIVGLAAALCIIALKYAGVTPSQALARTMDLLNP